MRKPQVYGAGDGDYLSRWKRIVHIDVRLREGGWPSAARLARECGVSTKSIYRDIEALRCELSAPIVYDASKKGFGYSEPGWAIPATALGERDLFALMVAENALAQYDGTPLASQLREAFDRVLALLPGEVRARHQLAARAVHFSGLPPVRLKPELWATLTQAIHSHQRLELDYFLPAKRAVEARTVEPYLLVVREREWFLVARTASQRNYALFYLPRIKAVRKLGEPFLPDAEFSAERYYEHGFNAMHGSGKPDTVELCFEPAHAHLADERNWAPRQELVRRRDGSVLVRFRTNALFEVERQVLRYGGAVEVLRPKALREAVRAGGERLAQLHGARS